MNNKFLFEVIDKAYTYMLHSGMFTSGRQEARVIENLLIQGRVQANEMTELYSLDDLKTAIEMARDTEYINILGECNKYTSDEIIEIINSIQHE